MGAKWTVTNLDGTVETFDTRTLADAQADAFKRLWRQFNPWEVDYDGGALIVAGRNYNGKNFQIDRNSRINIGQAAQTAVLAGSGYSELWVCSDNTTVTFDGSAPPSATSMVTFGLNVAAYYSALFVNYQALRTQINACTTVAECDAVDVTQGWPAN